MLYFLEGRDALAAPTTYFNILKKSKLSHLISWSLYNIYRTGSMADHL
jgi:hypothetical protein